MRRVWALFAACGALASALSAADTLDPRTLADTRPWQHRVFRAPGPVTSHGCGFHSDVALLAVVSALVSRSGVSAFVETGAYTGSTFAYMLRTYPHLTHAYTADISLAMYAYAAFEAKEAMALFRVMHAESEVPAGCGLFHAPSTEMLQEIVVRSPIVTHLTTLFWVRFPLCVTLHSACGVC